MFESGRAVVSVRIRAGVLVMVALVGCSAPTVSSPANPAAPVAILGEASAATTAPLTATPTNFAATATPSATPTATAPPIATDPTPAPTPSPSPEPVVELMAVGDLMLARGVGERIETEGPEVVFADVASRLAEADVLVGNLECVIAERGEPEPKAYVFRAPAQAAEALALMGFDVLSVANNHAMDFGEDGLVDMLGQLGAHGIAAVGAGFDDAAAHAPAVVERNGLRIATLAYVDVPVEGRSGFDTRSWLAGPASPGLAWADLVRVQTDVAAAASQADVVVVLLHFGLEGRAGVTAAQRALARGAVNAGAQLVLGAHPHVLQETEEYGGGVIAYSLGNFVFDGFGLPANYSAIFSATLTPDGVREYGWVPVIVEGGLPRLASEAESAPILTQVAVP